MDVYKVGPDDVGDDLQRYAERFVWIVYHYEAGSWEGSGEAVALGKDGLIYSANLSHCSCMGPFDESERTGFDDSKPESPEAYRDRDSIAHQSSAYPSVSNRVLELLSFVTA